MRCYHIAFLLTSLAGLWGCANNIEQEDPYHGIAEKKLFAKGQQALVDSEFQDAVEIFESFEVQYPLSVRAEQALLEYIYAQYRVREYDIMQAAADRFLRLYPRSKNADYLYYLKGIAATQNKRTIIDRYFSVDIAARDQSYMHDAYGYFKKLVRDYPKSIYVGDAKRRMVYLRNLFADEEVNTAALYLEKTAYVAAANRAQEIITTYGQAPQTERAFYILVQANRKLGLEKEAQDAMKLFVMNFPKSPYIDRLKT